MATSPFPWNFSCGCKAQGQYLEALTLVEACAGHAGLLEAARREGRESALADVEREAKASGFTLVGLAGILARLREGSR